MNADLVGITRLDRRWIRAAESPEGPFYVFSDEIEGGEQYDGGPPVWIDSKTKVIPKTMKYAISIAPAHDYEVNKWLPTKIGSAGATGRNYCLRAWVVCRIVRYIRALGYNAATETCGQLHTPIACDAGLGQAGRGIMTITPELGVAQRTVTVITDLPLEEDPAIDFGALDFCMVCKKCARNCPTGSIPFGDMTDGSEPNDVGAGPILGNNPGTVKWYLNHETCYIHGWCETGTGCGICQAVCPFNKGHAWHHEWTLWFAKNAPALDSFFVWLDDLLGYGKAPWRGGYPGYPGTPSAPTKEEADNWWYNPIFRVDNLKHCRLWM